MKTLKIAIASDHAGFKLKKDIIKYLHELGATVKDFGSYNEDPVDYPDYGHPLAKAIERGEYSKGISICGSGNGINMTVNKHQGIRSAICWNDEIARLARSHNDANICALPARFISKEEAISIVDVFLSTDFEGGRHILRINKISIND